jgi:transposase
MARALEVEAELANARAENSDLLARNALLELQAEKMRRAMYGARSERSERLIDQMELAFVELEETAAETSG